MKILLFHQYFRTPQTGGPIRSYYLAKALVEKQHKVVVITTYNELQYKFESVDGIAVHYLPIPYDNRFGFYARAKSFIKFIFHASRLGKKFRDFDISYAISVPLTVGLIVRWIKFRFGIPFLFEVGDLWPDAPIEMGIVRNVFLRSMLYRMERKIYRESGSIVALSPAIQSAIERKIPGKTVHLIPNMADTEFYGPGPKDPDFGANLGVDGKLVVSYIGALGIANGLERLIACAQESQSQKIPVHFIICGDGAMLGPLKENAQKLNLDNLSILPFADREGVRRILNISDAVFVSYAKFPILETGSPNKFFDGLAAGKLIITNFGGWIAREITENNCGIQVNEPADFVEKIKPFIADHSKLQQFQKNARELAEKKYSRKQLSERFAKLF